MKRQCLAHGNDFYNMVTKHGSTSDDHFYRITKMPFLSKKKLRNLMTDEEYRNII